ncbi:hypothetical protein VP01_2744g4 [Puccinia sorghi]|uniref:Uncharacterized protein n=1 Tax=Puccinia sorghi TaxID=27349 RepID=A0A0L6V355_9BASI|nr:hypothetical protein VP01_2744g4 [Puccinia sorghi]
MIYGWFAMSSLSRQRQQRFDGIFRKELTTLMKPSPKLKEVVDTLNPSSSLSTNSHAVVFPNHFQNLGKRTTNQLDSLQVFWSWRHNHNPNSHKDMLVTHIPLILDQWVNEQFDTGLAWKEINNLIRTPDILDVSTSHEIIY